ncbi:MAG: hypothetical protein O3C40_07405 [Planctomycetota bacterium]|nr:hypothetical protein [Planctomycetota bacterium]
MQFRQSGQGDERRRRVFRDERLAAPGREASEADDSRQNREDADDRVYPDAALAQRQTPITSLLPQRALTLVALLLGGGFAIAGIELLYARLLVGLPESLHASLAVFDLTARGNIAHWFASLTLVIGAATSMLVYLIRRHRLDDYRGRYRMWQWATACFMIGSFDAATGARAIFQPAMIQLTGTKLLGDGAVWSVLLTGIAVTTCLIRLAIEVKGSRLAASFLGLAAGSYVGCVVTNFHPALNAAELARVIASSATLLAGHFCLVYSVALYGRHVYQEAQGTRRAGRTKPVVAEPSAPKKARGPLSRRTEVVGSKNVRVDAAHEKPTTDSAPAAVPTISKTSIQKTVSAPAEPAVVGGPRPMSKAEKRRLRKLQRRQDRQDDDSED